MDASLEMYEWHLNLITDVCADPWFVDQLAVAAPRDEHASRGISGSCLRLVFAIAKRRSDSLLSLSRARRPDSQHFNDVGKTSTSRATIGPRYFFAALTTTVIGRDGSETNVLGFAIIFGSFANGTCACPCTAIMYSPGRVLP